MAGMDAGSGSSRRISALALALILLVSAYLQLNAASRTVVDTPIRADAREYFFYAYNLANFGIYSNRVTWPDTEQRPAPAPDKLRPPGYPAFLLLVGDPQPTLAYIGMVTRAQALLGVLSGWLMFLISSRFLRPGWSHAATLLTALSPHLVVMSTYLLSETLFTFMLYAWTYTALVAMRSQRTWAYVLSGVVGGVCILVRPTMDLFPIFLLALVFLVPKFRPYLRPALLMFAAILTVVAPWSIRNYSVERGAHEPSLMVNFILHGSYPGFTYKNDPDSYGDPYRSDPHSVAASADISSALKYTAQRFEDAPLRYIGWYLIGKPGFFLSWTNIDGVGDIFVYSVSRSPFFESAIFFRVWQLMFWLHWPLMLAGIFGITLIWQRSNFSILEENQILAARAVSIIITYAIAMHVIGTPYPRYGIPFRPLIFPFALLALWIVGQRISAKRSSREKPQITS